MNTTLNKIMEFSLSEPSWEKLLESLNKTKADDEPLSFKYILDVLGIRDALWCLCKLDYREQCLFLADVAESVLHIFEDKYPDDMRVRNCIDGIRKFHAGEIDYEDLMLLQIAAYYAVDPFDDNAVYAAALSAAYTTAYAVSATAAISSSEKWKEIEELFIKYFC